MQKLGSPSVNSLLVGILLFQHTDTAIWPRQETKAQEHTYNLPLSLSFLKPNFEKFSKFHPSHHSLGSQASFLHFVLPC